MDRRQFAKAATLFPLGIAMGSTLEAQETTTSEASTAAKDKAGLKHKTDAEYNRHPPILESDPFAEPLTFTHKEYAQKLQPFALDEVSLGPGPLLDARNWNRAFMMRLPNDRLLHNFRINAGIPSQATPLGGWEAPNSELRGHFVGHYLSAAALLNASTGDALVKRKGDELVAEIAECQLRLGQSGYVSAFPRQFFDRLDRTEKVWAPFYTLHKIMAGLLDMYALANNRQALEVVLGLAGWVDKWTGLRPEEHMQEILKNEFGGMNDVLYHLASVTGDDRWARTGDRFTKKEFFNPLAMRRDQLKGLHANTHMPQVIGAARRFSLSSDYRFRDVAEFFWNTVVEARTYAPGGSGNTESWLTNANRLALEMTASSHHQECCCAYNMMKLTRMLFGWTGDARFIDYYERNLFNHRLGTIQPGTGLTTYFLSMSPGAWKTLCTEDQTFWCCTGSALEEFGKLNDTIYFHDGRNIFVNLFVPSILHWKARGVRLNQRTKFPESDRTVITLESTPPDAWTLYLRVPVWTNRNHTVRINGELIPLWGTPGSYVAIERIWRSGDRVEMVMPMSFIAEPLPDDPTQQAILYGPIVLAAQFPRGEMDADLQHNQGPEMQELPPMMIPGLETKGQTVETWLKPLAEGPLTFRTYGLDEELTFRPLNQSWERFATYIKVTECPD